MMRGPMRSWPASCETCDLAWSFPCDSCPVSEGVRMAGELCGEARALDGGVEVPLPLAVPLAGPAGARGVHLVDVPWSLLRQAVEVRRKRDGARLW